MFNIPLCTLRVIRRSSLEDSLNANNVGTISNQLKLCLSVVVATVC